MTLNHVPETQRCCSWLLGGATGGVPHASPGSAGGNLVSGRSHLGRSVIPDPRQRLSHRTPRGKDRNPLWASQCLAEVSLPPSKSSCPAGVRHMPPPPLGSYQSPLMPSESFSVEFPQSSLLDGCLSSQLSAPDHGPALVAPCARASPPPPKTPRSEESSQPRGPGRPRKGSLRSKAELPPRTCPHKLPCLPCVSLEKVTCV